MERDTEREKEREREREREQEWVQGKGGSRKRGCENGGTETKRKGSRIEEVGDNREEGKRKTEKKEEKLCQCHAIFHSIILIILNSIILSEIKDNNNRHNKMTQWDNMYKGNMTL